MAISVGSSPVHIKELYFRPSLYESGSCKFEEKRRVSQLVLQPVNSARFHVVGPIRCCSLSNLSTSVITSAASPLVGPPHLSSFDSATRISLSSSAFLDSRTLNLVSKMRNRAEKGRVESPGLCQGSIDTKEETIITHDESKEENIRPEGGGGNGDGNGEGGGGGGGGGGGDAVGWISSALIFAFWVGLLVYGFILAPNQTQYRDTYFIEKLVGLHSDDGFTMNKVLVSEWYFMGLWPLIYSSLLIPNGRSRKNGAKVWPFAVVSFFLGVFALLPYFGLWRPPPPKVSRDELRRYPLNVLESKITAVAIIIGGLVIAWYAGSAGGDQWAEFLQYFQESRFINIMSIDFLTLSALAPFWVYNDLSFRQRLNTSAWLPSIAVIPFFGPALYLFLRPPLTSSSIDGSEDISAGSGSS